MRREPLVMDEQDHRGIPELEEKPDPVLLERYNAACDALLSAEDVVLVCSRSSCSFVSESMKASLSISERTEEFTDGGGPERYTVWVYKDTPDTASIITILQGNRKVDDPNIFQFPRV